MTAFAAQRVPLTDHRPPTDRVMALLQQDPAVQYLNISTPGRSDIRTSRSPGLHTTAQHVRDLLEQRYAPAQHPIIQIHLGFEGFQIYHSRYGFNAATLICSVLGQGENDWRDALGALLSEIMTDDDLEPQYRLEEAQILGVKDLIRGSLGPLAERAVNKIFKQRNLDVNTRFNAQHLNPLIADLTELASPSDRLELRRRLEQLFARWQ